MLVGIVKKNAIMMIDFAIEAQRSGKSAVLTLYLTPVSFLSQERVRGRASRRREAVSGMAPRPVA